MPRMCKKGFTLPEVLLSVAILAFCLSSLLASFINSIALNDAARNQLRALTHAEAIMESIKAASFSSIPGSSVCSTWNTWTLDASGIAAAGLTSFGGTQVTSTLKNEHVTTTLCGTNPVDITVVVSWEDVGARARAITLRTLVTG